jgi:hypothetical protein
MLIFTANEFYKGFEMWRIIGAPVPLTLLNFTAQKAGSKVALNWQTTNEINTALFEIERAGNAGFVKIGALPALNTAGQHRYEMHDGQPLEGTNFYRLKMIDIDGSFTYSPTKRVDFALTAQVRLAPNPASNEIKISEAGAYNYLQVIDASGRTMLQQKIASNQVVVNIQQLLKGNYVLLLTGVSEQQSIQFVKQ